MYLKIKVSFSSATMGKDWEAQLFFKLREDTGMLFVEKWGNVLHYQ